MYRHFSKPQNFVIIMSLPYASISTETDRKIICSKITMNNVLNRPKNKKKTDICKKKNNITKARYYNSVQK